MVEVNPIDILTDQTLAQYFVTDEVVKGMTIAPTLKMLATTAKRYDFFVRRHTSKEAADLNLVEEPLPSTPGSELTLVSSTTMQPNSQRLVRYGYRYKIETDSLEESPESFLMDMQDLCYRMARSVETNAANVLITNGSQYGIDTNFSPNDGAWETSSRISEDVNQMRRNYYKREISGDLNQLFYDFDHHTYLGDFIIRTEGTDALDAQGPNINYSSITHTYASALDLDETGPTNGIVFGYDKTSPPAVIAYRKIPGAYSPVTTEPGTEDYMPIVNMKILPDTNDMTPIREFQFGVECTIAAPLPKKIYYYSGI
jgi:hypothetical protein